MVYSLDIIFLFNYILILCNPGMRIMALDGHIDNTSLYCGGDRIIFLEVELPKVGNCDIGIFQHESLLAFVRIKGKCEAFCPGKVAINYITPLGNNVNADKSEKYF